MNIDRFFSQGDGAEIGSFHFGLGLLDATFSSEAHELLVSPERAKVYLKEPKTLIRLLLEITSYIHERRHFLDTFGTMAGMSLYSARLTCTKRLIEVGADLSDSNTPWQLPLSKWVKEAGCSISVRKLYRFARSFRTGSDAFIGSFPRFAVEGHTNEAWIRVPFSTLPNADTYDIPAFPLSMGMQSGDGTVRPISVIFPIGYEAVIEGTAHSLARDFVEAHFPSVPKEFMAHLGPRQTEIRIRRDHSDPLQQMAERASAYGATDFMVSKFLRTKGIPQFPRTLITRLADIALSVSTLSMKDISEGSTQIAFSCPGDTVIDLLQSVPAPDLKEARVPYPEVANVAYNAGLRELGKGGDWDTVVPLDSFFSAIRIWESFVAQHIAVPLLTKRLQEDHKCFSESSKTMDLLFDPKLPCTEVINGQINFGSMPEIVKNAWFIQMMAGEIAHQVFADCSMILCPRAHKLLPGMSTVDLSGGSCDKFELLGCGTWVPGQKNYLPHCLFSKSLAAYGFETTMPMV